MKAFACGAIWGCCLLGSLLPYAAAADQILWCADFRTASGLAAEQQRLVLLHFTQNNCAPCRKVEAEVFSQAKVGEAVAQNFVPVLVAMEKEPQLVARYQVKLFPTDVFVTPSGLEVYRAITPQKPADYIALLNQVARQTGTSTQRQWSQNLDKLAQQAAGGAAAANQAVTGAATTAQQSAATAQNTAGQFAAGVQGQATQGQQQWNRAVEQFGAATDQAQSTAQATAQQAASTGRDFQQQVVGAAEELHQQSTHEAQKSSDKWRQSLSSIQSDMRSAFVPPGGSNAAAAIENTAPPLAASQPPTTPPAPALPTENPWLTAAGRALNVPTPRPQPTPAPPLDVATVSPPEVAPLNATARGPGSDFQPHVAAPSPAPSAAPPPSAGPTVAASQAPPVAMDGFCVVSLIEKMAWKKADSKFGAIHRGRTYLFISAEAQKKFLQNPDAFAPALSGCDPVRFAKTGELVEGKRAYGLLTPDKRIFLFADEQSLQVFEKSPGEYAEMARQALLRGETGRTFR